MIEVAIVTPTTSPRNPTADDPRTEETRIGSIWVRRQDGSVRRRPLESTTAAAVKLELSAFFERFLDETLKVQVIQPVRADKTIAPAVTALVAAPVHDAPHGHRQFSKGTMLREGVTPFDYGFAAQAHVHFRPAWYVEPEPQILLKSSAGDHYTYPATDDTEDTEDERASTPTRRELKGEGYMRRLDLQTKRTEKATK